MRASVFDTAAAAYRHPGDLTRPFPRAGNWVCEENIHCLPFSWVTAWVELCKRHKLSVFGFELLYTFTGQPALSL